jgi:hypothetical protein
VEREQDMQNFQRKYLKERENFKKEGKMSFKIKIDLKTLGLN